MRAIAPGYRARKSATKQNTNESWTRKRCGLRIWVSQNSCVAVAQIIQPIGLVANRPVADLSSQILSISCFIPNAQVTELTEQFAV